jgi:uncharacterized membrane protein YdjX (TVP38/TMEM64 family)
MAGLRLPLLVAMLTAVIAFFYFDLPHYFTLDSLKARQYTLLAYRDQHFFQTIFLYALLYIGVTALSLPGAALLTLAGGGLFGLWWGTFIVSIASTIGATLAFLSARFLFRDVVYHKFGHYFKTFEEGLKREGAYYLFSLRLVPIIPFFGINLAMGLTTMKSSTFFWVSQIGMLPGTLLYVNAGTQLATIHSLSGILSPLVLGSLVLLGVFPLIVKKLIDAKQALE